MTKKRFIIFLFLIGLKGIVPIHGQSSSKVILKFPVNSATSINPDTHLTLTFPNKPVLHNSGKISIYDASTDALVDELDMSIAPGPKNTRTPEPYNSFSYKSIPDTTYTVSKPDTIKSHIYQKNFIGGTTEADGYHFFPVLIANNTATIFLHNNRLKYDKSYYVKIDAGVFTLSDGSAFEITNKKDWNFSTKKTAPSPKINQLVVAADGTGDFSTVQAAIDFIPENNSKRITLFIQNGIYEEMVYFRNKNNITIVGENRENTIIRYPNNGVFNTRLISADPNTATKYHNQRAVLAIQNSDGIQLINFTLQSVGEKPAQAEGLYIIGKENIVSHVTIDGSGDALQASGTMYLTDSQVKGFGDNVLGYGALFFNQCDFVSTFGPHLWVRNTQENHGNVLLNCTLRTIGDVETTIARAPNSNGKSYPYVEAVLIDCSMEGIRPEGWGKVADVTDGIRYWEFNSKNLDNGQTIDVSQRHPASRQLTMEKDAEIINNYKNPTFVLGGWTPQLAPQIISQPSATTTKAGQTASFEVKTTAMPIAKYQWFKDGKAIENANNSLLKIENAKSKDSGVYTVSITNTLGSTESKKISFQVN